MAIMAVIGNATKHGFLVREGDALERLAKVSKITFDKTGTLTYGTPKVVAVKTCQKETDADTLYQMCASAEQMSEHPLGKAVVSCYKESCQKNLPAAETFEMLPGRGVSAVINGKMLLAGNPEDKLNWIADYQKKEEAVCMIGDGVNDAPALKRADVGIAMGGVGSDIAVDAAAIALVDD